MDLFAHLKEEFNRIIVSFYNSSFLFIDVENSKRPELGDISTNALMLLARAVKKPYTELAPAFLKQIKEIDVIETADVAIPGFINIKIKNKVWQSLISVINKSPSTFGQENLGRGEKINIEFVSANPTGPLHIGHIRGAILFDVVANLLDRFGFSITREYYINDAGGQVQKLINSCYVRYQEACGVDVETATADYPGEYLKKIAQELYQVHNNSLLNLPEKQCLLIIRTFTITAILELIKSDLKLLGIEHDVFTSEDALLQQGKVEKSINLLEQKGLIYDQVLGAPKGGSLVNWKPRKQLVFKATNFGDTEDRALTKEDGDWTYFASDIAYHYDKMQRGFKKMIVGLAVDHFGYVKRLKAIVQALSDGKCEIEVSTYNIVNFMEDGKVTKMSKRSGKFLGVKDVVDEIGVDSLRFMMLTCRGDRLLDFDFSKVKEQSQNNPVFYVQYAHARACSVLRKAEELNLNELNEDLTALVKAEEILLIKMLALWPRVSKLAALNYEPHKITLYLYNLAECFHTLWNCGKKELDFRFINPQNLSLTLARVALVKATANIIAQALKILNIQAVEQM